MARKRTKARREDFDAVLFLVGLKASGKDVFSRAMATRGFIECRISDPLRAEAVKRRLAAGMDPETAAKFTVSDLQDVGNDFRAMGGPGYPAELMLDMAFAKGCRRPVVNGVRNPGEIESLIRIVGRKKIFFAGLTAPTDARAARAGVRYQPEDPRDLLQFLKNDDRDRGIGEPPHGQHVDRCLAWIAAQDPTLIYNNAGPLEVYHSWIDAFCTRFGL